MCPIPPYLSDCQLGATQCLCSINQKPLFSSCSWRPAQRAAESVKPSTPTLLHILAYMPRQKHAELGRGRTRGSFQPSRLLTSYPQCPLLGRVSTAPFRLPRPSTGVALTALTIPIARRGSRRLVVSIPPGATSESFSTSCHRSAWRTPGSQASLWPARGMPYRCQWDEILPD